MLEGLHIKQFHLSRIKEKAVCMEKFTFQKKLAGRTNVLLDVKYPHLLYSTRLLQQNTEFRDVLCL